MQRLGIESLELSRDNRVKAECAICSIDVLPGESCYIIVTKRETDDDMEVEGLAFHEYCFFHMIVAIRQYFDKFGIELPEELRGAKTN